MDKNQKIFVEVSYKEPYDSYLYTKIISISDYELEELIKSKFRQEIMLKDYTLYTMHKIAKVNSYTSLDADET